MSMRKLLRASFGTCTAATILALLATGGGCGSSGATSSRAQPVVATCPGTIAQTVGAGCTAAGLVCGPSYACGATDVPLLCVCDGRTFQCTDGVGNQIHSADQVSCPTPIDAGSSCPRTESAAPLAPCRSPGLLCEYPSSCAGTFDQCECFAGATADGGFGLRFECRPSVCGPSDAAGVTVVDAGLDSSLVVDSSAHADSGNADSGPAIRLDSSADEGSAPPVDAGGAQVGDADSSTDAANDSDSPAGDARPE